MVAWEAAMSLQVYYTYVGPALIVAAGVMIVAIGLFFTRDRHPTAGE
jgi:hypothetical protein